MVQIIANCLWRLNRIATDDRAVTAYASARSFEMHVKTLATLTLYEQRISRQFERPLKLFKETQAERKRGQEADLQRAILLKEHHDELQAQQPQPVPYNPAPYNPANGEFVFSNGMLEALIARDDRYDAAFLARLHPEEEAAA